VTGPLHLLGKLSLLEEVRASEEEEVEAAMVALSGKAGPVLVTKFPATRALSRVITVRGGRFLMLE